jgi:hypothetical protein
MKELFFGDLLNFKSSTKRLDAEKVEEWLFNSLPVRKGQGRCK